MRPAAVPDEPASLRSAPPSAAVILVIGLWLVFACGLPLYKLHLARQQAHQHLQTLLTPEKVDASGVAAAFDRANESLDAVASGPCLFLALTSIFLVNRLLKTRRRCDALAEELAVFGRRQIATAETTKNEGYPAS